MSEIPYYVVINKPNKQMKLEQKFVHGVGKDFEDIYNKIVYVVQEEFQIFPDIPDDYDNFVSKCWFLDYSADVEPFEYKLFHDGKWCEPWEHDEIYDKVYEVLHKLELLGGLITEANKGEFDEADEITDE